MCEVFFTRLKNSFETKSTYLLYRSMYNIYAEKKQKKNEKESLFMNGNSTMGTRKHRQYQLTGFTTGWLFPVSSYLYNLILPIYTVYLYTLQTISDANQNIKNKMKKTRENY